MPTLMTSISSPRPPSPSRRGITTPQAAQEPRRVKLLRRLLGVQVALAERTWTGPKGAHHPIK